MANGWFFLSRLEYMKWGRKPFWSPPPLVTLVGIGLQPYADIESQLESGVEIICKFAV